MNKVNISPSMLTQAYRAAEEIGNVLGRKVGIDQLAQIVELLDGKEVIKPEVQAVARNTRPTASKNIASKKSSRKARYKTQGQHQGDIKIAVVHSVTGKSLRWDHVPVDELFDGEEHTVFLPTSQHEVGKALQMNLRHKANRLGFGLKVTKLSINRYRVQMVELRPMGLRHPNRLPEA